MSILDRNRELTDRLLDRNRELTDRLLDRNRELTYRLNREASQRGDVGTYHREMVASDEYGRTLTIGPSGVALEPWALTIRPLLGAARVTHHATIEHAQRYAAGAIGQSRLMTGWAWIAVALAR